MYVKYEVRSFNCFRAILAFYDQNFRGVHDSAITDCQTLDENSMSAIHSTY